MCVASKNAKNFNLALYISHRNSRQVLLPRIFNTNTCTCEENGEDIRCIVRNVIELPGEERFFPIEGGGPARHALTRELYKREYTKLEGES